MSFMNSPTRLGLISQPSSFGTDTFNRRTSYFQKHDLSFGEGTNIQSINFRYISGQTYSLINRELRLHNESKSHFIKFVIECNNPHHYKVFPANGDIPPGKTIEISIQIVGVEEIHELKRNFFATFASDKFRITWYSYKESDKNYDETIAKVIRSPNSQTLSVNVEYNEEPTLQNELRKKSVEAEKKVERNLEIHKQELARLEALIADKQSQRREDAWIYPKLVIFLSLTAFLFGLLIPF